MYINLYEKGKKKEHENESAKILLKSVDRHPFIEKLHYIIR